MPRIKKARKCYYKSYYNRDSDSDVPESTLRYIKQPCTLNSVAADEQSYHGNENEVVVQTSNSSFVVQSTVYPEDIESNESLCKFQEEDNAGTNCNARSHKTSEKMCCHSSHGKRNVQMDQHMQFTTKRSFIKADESENHQETPSEGDDSITYSQETSSDDDSSTIYSRQETSSEGDDSTTYSKETSSDDDSTIYSRQETSSEGDDSTTYSKETSSDDDSTIYSRQETSSEGDDRLNTFSQQYVDSNHRHDSGNGTSDKPSHNTHQISNSNEVDNSFLDGNFTTASQGFSFIQQPNGFEARNETFSGLQGEDIEGHYSCGSDDGNFSHDSGLETRTLKMHQHLQCNDKGCSRDENDVINNHSFNAGSPPSSPPSSSSSSSTSRRSSSSDHEEGSEEAEREERNEFEQSDEDGEELRESFRRLKRCLPSFREKLHLNVEISIGEILINALTLVKKHNWSHLEKEHLMKFVNSVLNNGKLLPDSRFLLDQLFHSKDDMHYHFFCFHCFKYLGAVPSTDPRPNQIVCPNCRNVNVLSDLSRATYFVTFHLPSQMEVLLSDPKIRGKLLNPSDFADPPPGNIMRDLHHGSMYRDFALHVKSDEDLSNHRIFSFTLCIDSAALCHTSSGLAICPALVSINELPQVLRNGNPLVAGLWFGAKKEKMDLIIPPLVEHFIEFSTRGFSLNFVDNEVWLAKAFLIGCCVDSGARYDVQGIHSHRGEYPCSWCLIEGEEYQGVVRIFRCDGPLPERRTIQELVADSREALRTNEIIRGVKYLCPLAPAPLFHPVDGFIVDPMHSKDEGTTKSFLKAWMGEFGAKKNFYIGSPEDVKRINKRMKQQQVPKEFRHGIKMLSDIPYWTGRQLENWGMFLSVAVLVDILPERYLKHWSLFVQASHIYLNKNLPIEAVDIAEALIELFASKTENMYNAYMMRFNLHLARHYGENTRRWGPMFALSAYGFEHGNQILKKVIHNSNYIPSQICRGLSETNALRLMNLHCASMNTKSFEEDIDKKKLQSAIELPGNIRLLHHGKVFHPTEEEEWYINKIEKESSDFVVFSEVYKDGCHFGSSPKSRNHDNSYVRLIDKKIVFIRKILYHELSGEIWIFTSIVRCQPSLFCPPSVIRFDPNLCFQFEVSSVDDDIEFHSLNDLDTVCVSLKVDQRHFISPMPNLYNMF